MLPRQTKQSKREILMLFQPAKFAVSPGLPILLNGTKTYPLAHLPNLGLTTD